MPERKCIFSADVFPNLTRPKGGIIPFGIKIELFTSHTFPQQFPRAGSSRLTAHGWLSWVECWRRLVPRSWRRRWAAEFGQKWRLIPSNAPPQLLIRDLSCCACVQLDLGETFVIMMMMIVGPIICCRPYNRFFLLLLLQSLLPIIIINYCRSLLKHLHFHDSTIAINIQKMLENWPEDALVKLLKTVETVETAETNGDTIWR